jgi:hypothetical protein
MILLEVSSLHPFVFPVNVTCKWGLYNDDKQQPKLQTAAFEFYEKTAKYISHNEYSTVPVTGENPFPVSYLSPQISNSLGWERVWILAARLVTNRKER